MNKVGSHMSQINGVWGTVHIESMLNVSIVRVLEKKTDLKAVEYS